jgi:hypothetical protein
MATAMTLIGSITLTATQTSVTFGSGGSIPQTYRDLRLVMVFDNATTANTLVRINGDSGNNYTMVGMGYNWQPATWAATNWATGSFSDSRGYPPGGYSGGNMQTYDFFDYAISNKHKSVLMRAQGQPTAAANGGLDFTTQRWASTSAITSLTISANSGAFAIGSTFYLYGIAG